MANKKSIDWIVVGAGFTGAVFAERLATQRRQRVLVIERRTHVAGDAYDYTNGDGHLVHKFGPHVFFTNSERVFNYASQFTHWINYRHYARVNLEGRLVPFPINLNSIDMMFPSQKAKEIQEALKRNYGMERHVPILKLLQSADRACVELGEYVYQHVFLGYTRKLWGCRPEDLDNLVTARVPIRVTCKDEYHHTTYSGIPSKGYTALISRILDHPLIEVLTDTDYHQIRSAIHAKRTLFTGPIDEYFDCCYGRLPYRSLRMEYKTGEVKGPRVPQVNYPGEQPYTRVSDPDVFIGKGNSRSTTLVYEHPAPYSPGENEPHYPVPARSVARLFERYVSLAKTVRHETMFVGRNANYQYINMDQAIGKALQLFDRFVGKNS